MAIYSYIESTGDGSTSIFAVPFDYINESDVHVFIDGVEDTGASFTSPGTIQTSVVPPADSIIFITRATDLTERAVDFTTGSLLTEEDLDASAEQVFKVAQEAIDASGRNLPLDYTNKYNAYGRKITGVAYGTDPTDVISKAQLDYDYPAVENVSNNMDDVNAIVANMDDVNRLEDSITIIDRLGSSADNIDRVHQSITELDRVHASIGNIDTVEDHIANVDTVATGIDKVDTLASIAQDITDVAAIDTNVTTVANNDTNVTKVATIDNEVTTVAGIERDVQRVANLQDPHPKQEFLDDFAKVVTGITDTSQYVDTGFRDFLLSYYNSYRYGDITEGGLVNSGDYDLFLKYYQGKYHQLDNDQYTWIKDVLIDGMEAQTFGDLYLDKFILSDLDEIASEIVAVENNLSDVVAVANNESNITAVANNETNINTVSNRNTQVTTVSDNIASVLVVDNSIANVNTVASIDTQVNTVANIDSDVTTVANISTDVETVASSATQIGTVSNRDTDIGTVAARDAAIGVVAARDSDIATVATDLSGTDTIGTVAANITDVNNAYSNAQAAITARTGAETAETNAETAQVAAELARDQAYGATNLYPDSASGLAATTSGDYFSVVGTGNTFITLYKNDSGSAVEQNSLYADDKIDEMEDTQITTAFVQAAAISQIQARLASSIVFPD
jgi:hypothetical protein